MPGSTRALFRVERDTVLPFAPNAMGAASFSGMATGPRDSLLARPDTPMPAARVRLLMLDSASRATLAAAGITDSQPAVFIRAAPYRADCRVERWTDSLPWVHTGDVGYARATLAPRDRWIGDTPVLVIPDVWNYPYPRRRGLAFQAAADARLAPPAALYAVNELLFARTGGDLTRATRNDAAGLARAVQWARTNREAAELEPIRSIVRGAALDADAAKVTATPSRLRGSYRVTLRAGDTEGTWYFRTHDKPGYSWRERDTMRTVADIIALPYIAGYKLVGLAAATADSMVSAAPRGPMRDVPLVWLSATDQPFAPGNDARTSLDAELEFKRNAAPAAFWDVLDAFQRPLSEREREMLERMRALPERAQQQVVLPMRLRVGRDGVIQADTTILRGARRLRVTLTRLDSTSVARPW